MRMAILWEADEEDYIVDRFITVAILWTGMARICERSHPAFKATLRPARMEKKIKS